jgi:probable phosphoglycerate mutase
MVEIVLVRPGRTEFDEQRRIAGTLDIPLCEAGSDDVRCLIDELRKFPIDVVYMSPCRAARETAEPLAEALEVRVKELDQLRNLDQGLWQGRGIDEVRQTQPTVYRQWQENPESICPPSGEPVASAQQRARSAATKLRRKHEGRTIAIVAPEPMYSLLYCELAGGSPRDLWKAPCEGRRWTLVSGGKPELAPTG